MDDTLEVIDTYWEMLRSLGDDMKLCLATRLTVSVVAGEVTHKNRTQDVIEKYMGKWKDKRGTGKIIKDTYEGRESIKALLNFD